MVARQHQDALDTQGTQTLERLGGVGAQAVLQGDDAQQLAAQADVERGLAFGLQALDVLLVGTHVNGLVLFEEVARADHDTLALDDAGHAVGGDEVDILVREVAVAVPAGRFDHGMSQRVEVVLFHRGGQVEHVGGVELGVEGQHVGDDQGAGGEGAGLVEDEGVGLGEALQCVTALEQHAVTAGGVHGGLEGDRGGELERAGIVGLQHGGGPLPVARYQPGAAGQTQDPGHQLVGQAVGGELGAALDLQGVLDVVGDSGAGRAGTDMLGVDADAAFLDDGAAEHVVTPLAQRRHALAGHAGFVDGGLATEHGTVNRDDGTCCTDDGIADHHLGGVDLHLLALALNPDRVGIGVQQVLEQVVGAAGDGLFQVLAQRQHEERGVGGHLVAAGGGNGHGQRFQHVVVEPFLEQILDGVLVQRQRDGQRGRFCQRLGHLVGGQQQQCAGQQVTAGGQHVLAGLALLAAGSLDGGAAGAGADRGWNVREHALQLGDAGLLAVELDGDGTCCRVQAHTRDTGLVTYHALQCLGRQLGAALGQRVAIADSAVRLVSHIERLEQQGGCGVGGRRAPFGVRLLFQGHDVQ